MAGRCCEGKIKMASKKVSRKMVLEIKYVNANNAVIHTENLVTGIWYPPSRPSLSFNYLDFTTHKPFRDSFLN